jgi:hypothetical protein
MKTRILKPLCRVIWILLLILSCKENSTQESQLSVAVAQFEKDKAEMGMEDFTYFKEPIIIESINGILQDSNYVVFGWHYIHHMDTFWMYSYVNKDANYKRKSYETGVGYSSNFSELQLNWKEWVK